MTPCNSTVSLTRAVFCGVWSSMMLPRKSSVRMSCGVSVPNDGPKRFMSMRSGDHDADVAGIGHAHPSTKENARRATDVELELVEVQKWLGFGCHGDLREAQGLYRNCGKGKSEPRIFKDEHGSMHFLAFEDP